MKDVFGNAAGFTQVPTIEQITRVSDSFALGNLLAESANCPMFVINGDQDVHVPLSDTQLFEGRPDPEVQIVPGGTHCAFNKVGEVIAANTKWLAAALH